MEMTTLVLKIKGLSEEQIQEHFSEFFNDLVDKYPNQFGVGLSAMTKGTEEEQQILKIADLL
ncbi:hypothetical protein [Enterococcus sp. DIV0800]|uniref:hypothetical protein n=1 Tax=unclassified Enterococcus TaxID=2608891 RepID=UPI003D300716